MAVVTEQASIFISYRREDSSGSAGRLCQDLRNRFGEEQVFFDVDDITVGADYRKPIDARIAGVTVFLAIIGPDWRGERRDGTGRRIDEPEDPVRKEIEMALARNIEIIPVLVEGATMPPADTLPPSIQPLAYRNAIELRHTRWHRDSGDFMDVIARRLGRASTSEPPAGNRRKDRPLRALLLPCVTIAVLMVLGIGGYRLYQGREADEFLDRGIEAQYSTDPNLERARQAYLRALQLRPQLAPAHFHLAHVYAFMQAPELARHEFELALRYRTGLDALQLESAQNQLKMLASGAQNRPATVSQQILTAPKIATAAGELPYVQPDSHQQERLSLLVARMFSDDRDTRVASTTTLLLDPAGIPDATPIAVRFARRMQQQRQESNRSQVDSGVINTFVLLRSASPVTLIRLTAQLRALGSAARTNGAQTAAIVDEIMDRVDAAQGKRPVAAIHIADASQRSIADTLAQALRDAGYDVGQIDMTRNESPTGRSEIRSVGASDQALARWQARKIWSLVGGDVAITTLQQKTAKVDTYEIWLDRNLCTARPASACS